MFTHFLDILTKTTFHSVKQLLVGNTEENETKKKRAREGKEKGDDSSFLCLYTMRKGDEHFFLCLVC